MESEAKALVELLKNSGYEAFYVGGCVRDMKMGNEPHDYDICTNATPNQIIRVTRATGYRYYDAGIKFGTVNVQTDNNMFEITTYRCESGYRDSRRPDSVKFIQNIDGDLSRRDFTINAMAYDPVENKFIDPFGGQLDLRSKTVRAVGNPNERFEEDALRILRAMRFAIKYEFGIEDNTFMAMLAHKDNLNNISKERVTQELEKMLTCGKPVKNIFMKCRDIIAVIFTDIVKCFDFEQKSRFHIHNVYEHMLYVVDYCKTNKFEIKLAALLHDIGKPKAFFIGDDGYGHFHGHPEDSYEICVPLLKNSLRLSSESYDLTINLIRYHDSSIMDTDKSVLRFLSNHGEKFMRDFLILRQADIDDHINLNTGGNRPCCDMSIIENRLNAIISRNMAFSIKNLAINGNEVCEVTHTVPGKHIGMILNQLLEDVINNVVDNTNEALRLRAVDIWENVGN